MRDFAEASEHATLSDIPLCHLIHRSSSVSKGATATASKTASSTRSYTLTASSSLPHPSRTILDVARTGQRISLNICLFVLLRQANGEGGWFSIRRPIFIQLPSARPIFHRFHSISSISRCGLSATPSILHESSSLPVQIASRRSSAYYAISARCSTTSS